MDSSNVVEWLSEDTFICHNIIKRVWPASQRDALFWTHIRHMQGDTDEEPDLWLVINYSTDHENIPVRNWIFWSLTSELARKILYVGTIIHVHMYLRTIMILQVMKKYWQGNKLHFFPAKESLKWGCRNHHMVCWFVSLLESYLSFSTDCS